MMISTNNPHILCYTTYFGMTSKLPSNVVPVCIGCKCCLVCGLYSSTTAYK